MNIECLPDDVLVKIFSNLSLEELVENVGHTSTRWSILSRDFYLWRVVRIGQNETTLQGIRHAILEMSKSIEEITFECENRHVRELLLIHMYRFTKLTRLRLVNIYAVKLYVDLIAACPSLQYLELRKDDRRRDKIIKAIIQFEDLRPIDISRHIHLDCLESLSRCTLAGFPFLHTLIISGAVFPYIVINEIYKGSPLLKTLHLLKCGHLSIEAFTDMPGHCDCLEELSFSCDRLELPRLGLGNKLTEKDVIFVVGNLPNLRSLSLKSLQYFDFTYRIIACIAESCKLLVSLSIEARQFDLTEAGVCALLRSCTHLRKLNLSYVKDVGYTHFNMELGHFRTLEYLKLPGCSITDESIILLRQNAVNLRVLELMRSDYITGFSISQIVINCRRLVHLSVSGGKKELDLNFDEFYEKNTTFGHKPLTVYKRDCFRGDYKLLPLVQPTGVQNEYRSDIHLERRPISSRLKCISFEDTRVSNRSVIQIAKHCQDLDTFIMLENEVYDHAVEALVKNCQCLRTLKVRGALLSDAGLCAIANYGSNLRSLSILHPDPRKCINSIENLVAKWNLK